MFKRYYTFFLTSSFASFTSAEEMSGRVWAVWFESVTLKGQTVFFSVLFGWASFISLGVDQPFQNFMMIG